MEQNEQFPLTTIVTEVDCEIPMAHKTEQPTLAESRDGGYPTYPADEAIRIGQAVYDLGGSRAPVKKEMLAKHLNYAGTGPSFVQRIGAAKLYGLIDGRGEYALTDLGKRYFLPTSETDKAEAAFEILQHPPAFKRLVARFSGQRLPSNDILGNIIHTEGNVPASWKDKVASIFAKSAVALSLIDSQGNLRATAQASTGGKVDQNDDEQHGSEVEKPPQGKPPADMPGTRTHVMPMSNGRQVEVNAPIDMTKAEIQRFQKWAELSLLIDWEEKPNT
jgi:hypothetical protein